MNRVELPRVDPQDRGAAATETIGPGERILVEGKREERRNE